MIRRLVLVGLLPLCLAACVSGAGGGRGTARPSTPAPATPSLNTTGPWRPPTPTGFERVSITTDAVVVISGDTLVRTDTLHASLGASYTWTGGAARKVDGQLIDYRVAIGAAVAMAPAGLQMPRPFSASARTASATLSFTLPAESSACTEPTLSVLQGLQDVWIALPSELKIGTEWSDTVHTLSCRDRVPLRGTSVRRFVVRRGEVEDGKRVLVIIERATRGRLSGDGEQFAEKVAISGESSGTLRYAYDPLTGRFVRASGSATLTFSLKSSRRNQTVRQVSTLTLAW